MPNCWSTPILGADGRILGTFATYLKRTGMPSRRDLELVGRMAQLAKIAIERRVSEDALRESERRFRGLFENVVEGVYQVTMDGYLVSANPALIEMLGYASLQELRAVGSTERLYVDPGKRGWTRAQATGSVSPNVWWSHTIKSTPAAARKAASSRAAIPLSTEITTVTPSATARSMRSMPRP